MCPENAEPTKQGRKRAIYLIEGKKRYLREDPFVERRKESFISISHYTIIVLIIGDYKTV